MAVVWRAVVVLIGLVLLLLGYYWVHKPTGSPSEDAALAQSLGGALLDLLTAGALFAVAGAVGRRALIRLDLAALSTPERIALEGVIGLGVISLVALGLGLVGLFRGLVFWPLLLVTALLLRRDLRGWVSAGVGLIGRMRLDTGWMRYLAFLTGLLLALAVIRALAPPYAWDAYTYHLVAPSRYLAAGRIVAAPDNFFLGFPELAELLYGVGMSLFGRDTVPALIHFGFGLFGLLAVAGLTARHADRAAGWLAALLLVSAASIWLLLGYPYVDLAALACGAAALVAATLWRSTRRGGLLMLMGVFVGLALGVKYTSVGLGIALAVYIFVSEPCRALRNGLIFGLAALLAFAPWLLKGALLYGNPLYPFLFGGLNWDAQRAATFSASPGLIANGSAWQLPMLPFAATVFGIELGAGYAFTAGPWLLTAPLLLFIGWKWLPETPRALARDCALIGVPLLLFWALMAASSGIGMQTRLVMVGLPVAAVAGALGIYSLSLMPEKPVFVGFIVRAALALTLLYGVIDVARQFVSGGASSALLALETRDQYLDANLQAHAGAMRELASLPPGSRVLLMWEPRSFDCPPGIACEPDILFDHWAYPLKNGATPDSVMTAWHESGIGYLLVWDTGYEGNANDPRFAAENALFPAARDRWLTPVWTDGVRYTLYRWKAAR
jgi:hypothetical protein